MAPQCSSDFLSTICSQTCLKMHLQQTLRFDSQVTKFGVCHCPAHCLCLDLTLWCISPKSSHLWAWVENWSDTWPGKMLTSVLVPAVSRLTTVSRRSASTPFFENSNQTWFGQTIVRTSMWFKWRWPKPFSLHGQKVSLSQALERFAVRYSASPKNYRPTKISWTINLVMHYRPITDNNFSEINYLVLPFPVGNGCWVFSVCLSRFGPSALLKQIVHIHWIPKSVWIRYTALMDSKKSSQKLRKAVTDCKVLKEPPGFGPKSLSESSGNPRDCAYRLQKSLDQNLSESSRTPRYYVHKFHKCLETRGFGLKNCVPKLQNALQNSTICHATSANFGTKVQQLYLRSANASALDK